MVLKIDPAAREYLQQKGSKAVTVHVEYSGGGWCGAVPVLRIGIEAPVEPRGYLKFEIEGFDVYLSRQLRLQDKIHVKLQKFLFIKNLAVDGVLLTV